MGVAGVIRKRLIRVTTIKHFHEVEYIKNLMVHLLTLILYHFPIGTSVSSRKAIVDSNEINLDEEANVDEESFRSDLERDSAHSSMT